MRIALLSHEFPPETGGGGIGTYLAQVSGLLAQAGHDVTVFAGGTSHHETDTSRGNGVRLIRIPCARSQEFSDRVVPTFARFHQEQTFDVVEGNDFDASALGVKQAHPRLPVVAKLHTPRFVIEELNTPPRTLAQSVRMTLGAWRRGRLRVRSDSAARRQEIAFLKCADAWAAPTRFVGEAARRWANRAPDTMAVFPYPYEPPPALLDHPIQRQTHRVTFVGRLEIRKGVLDLARAIPAVLKRCPEARFRFIGRSMPHGPAGRPMAETLRHMLRPHLDAVEFTGPLPPEAVYAALGDTDVMVAPSHWESFGLVCCEGLAAGAAVVGSAHSGMVEILDQGRCGRLVAPHDPTALADTLADLLLHPDDRMALAHRGRQHVLQTFNRNVVIPAQLACYESAIRHATSAPAPR